MTRTRPGVERRSGCMVWIRCRAVVVLIALSSFACSGSDGDASAGMPLPTLVSPTGTWQAESQAETVFGGRMRLEFREDGEVSIADRCTPMLAHWSQRPDGSLKIQPGPQGLIACPTVTNVFARVSEAVIAADGVLSLFGVDASGAPVTVRYMRT